MSSNNTVFLLALLDVLSFSDSISLSLSTSRQSSVIMSDVEDSTPLEVQRMFGAGIKRKRIDFVPAGGASTESTRQPNPPTLTGDKYLSIVLKNGASSSEFNTSNTQAPNASESLSHHQLEPKGAVCEICRLPIKASDDASTTSSEPHEASIAHQVCLQHSRPPSHLNRDRQGLKYLSSYGWDPDSGLGLGATGEGIRVPIKVKVKNDTVGLGVELRETKKGPEKNVELLDAKKVRKKNLEDRKKREKLQQMFYGNDDVERYLGGG